MAPLNENSPLIFQMGANLVTGALPDEHKADMQMLGQGVTQILRNRFLTQQAEDFKQNELAQFMQATSQFGTNMSMIEDPNQRVQALMDYKNSVMLPFITNTSLKYANNDTIMNTAKSVFQMGPQLKDYIEAGNLQNQTAQVDIEQQNADTNTQNAKTNALEAKNRAAALHLEMMTKAPINPNAPSAEIEERLRNLPQQERESIDTDSLEMAATAYARSQGRGYDPDRNTQWNTTFRSSKDAEGNVIEGDLDRAKRELSSNGDLLKKILFVGRGIEKLGADKFKEKFPDQYTDVLPYFTGAIEHPPVALMKGAVPDNVIAGVFMNQVVPDKKMTVDQMASQIKLADRPEELGDRFSSVMNSAIQKKGNLLVLGGTDDVVPFSPTDRKGNRALLEKILKKQLNDELLDKIVSKDSNSITTRKKVQTLIDAALDRFLDDYAKDRGIPVTPTRSSAGRTATEVVPSGSSEDAAGAIFSNARRLGGIF